MKSSKKRNCPYMKGCGVASSKSFLNSCREGRYFSCQIYRNRESEKASKHQSAGKLEELSKE